MLRRALLLAALLGIACHVTAGLQCTQCDENFDGQAACNAAGSVVDCEDNEVCFAQIKCDGRSASFWMKGCIKATKVDTLNTVVCQNNKCTLGCDSDNCNDLVDEAPTNVLKCMPPTGPSCMSCTRVFDSQQACNDEAVEVVCANDEICTTDVHCDGPDRKFFDKGCKRRRQIADGDIGRVVCNARRNRCQYHCEGDLCNANAPDAVADTLRRCNRVDPPTPTPVFGPQCLSCERVFESQDACNAVATVVQCEADEVCTTDVHCDGPTRKFFDKGCKRRRQIAAGDIGRVVCNARRNRCQYHCEGEMCNTNAPDAVADTLRRCNRVDPPTPTPVFGPQCVSCERVFESQDACNAVATVVQCEADEVCTTDVHCDGPTRKFFDKGCKRRRQIAAGDIGRVVCNARRNRCQYHCEGELCNTNAPDAVADTLRRCNRVPPIDATVTPIVDPTDEPTEEPPEVTTLMPTMGDPLGGTTEEAPATEPPVTEPPVTDPPDKCTPTENGKCKCTCTCESECPAIPM